MSILKMLQAHPDVRGQVDEALAKCLAEAVACAAVCQSCADACIAENEGGKLVQCIRLNLDCADMCEAVSRVALRRAGTDATLVRPLLELTAITCDRCAEECERHAGEIGRAHV